MSFLPAKLNDTREIRHGRKAGISPLAATFIVLIMLLLMLVPTYHLGNSIGAHLAPHGGYVLVVIFLVAFAVATGEVVLSILNYYKEKKTDTIDASGRRGIMLVIILTTLTGAYSFHVDTAQEAIQADSHSQQSATFSLRGKALKSQWQADMVGVKSSAEQSRLTAQYNSDRAALSSQIARHKAQAIVQTSGTAKIVLTFLYGVFSFVCSMVLVAYSRFFVTYAKQLVELPIIAYLDKFRLDWIEGKAQGSDVIIDAGTGKKKVMRDEPLPYSVELNKTTTYHAKNTRPSGTESDSQESADTRPTPNRPEPVDTRAGAILDDENDVSVRTLNEDSKQGGYLQYDQHHYLAIKKAVIKGDIKPTVRPIKAELFRLKIKFVDDSARQKKAGEILEQLNEQGVIILNPEFGNSGKIVAKFILNPDSEKSEQGGAPFWIDEAVEMKHSNVPYFCFEDDESGVYRLAILSPDRQQTLCEFATLDAEEMADELRPDESGNNSEKYQAFLNSLKQYRKLQK